MDVPDIFPVTLKVPPILTAPPIPTPPEIINAPDVVELETVPSEINVRPALITNAYEFVILILVPANGAFSIYNEEAIVVVTLVFDADNVIRLI